jgi:hypothetical protein
MVLSVPDHHWAKSEYPAFWRGSARKGTVFDVDLVGAIETSFREVFDFTDIIACDEVQVEILLEVLDFELRRAPARRICVFVLNSLGKERYDAFLYAFLADWAFGDESRFQLCLVLETDGALERHRAVHGTR